MRRMDRRKGADVRKGVAAASLSRRIGALGERCERRRRCVNGSRAGKQTLHHKRAAVFIMTMWLVVVIAALVLVMARSMRVEALASANRLSQIQADAAERGVEKFLCCVVDREVASPGSTSNVSMEARRLGNCWFWVLKPDPDDEQRQAYGLTDEAGKIDLNTASHSMLALLPSMPPEIASSIFNWRGVFPDGEGTGATDADYLALPDPYRCKHSSFETTEELLLVKGVDDALLFGADRNRDGWVDSSEVAAANPMALINSGEPSLRGIFPYVTAYGSRATNAPRASSGKEPVNVNVSATQAGEQVQYEDRALREVLETAGVSNVAEAIRLGEAAQTRLGNFQTVLQWAAYANISSSDFSGIYPELGATPVVGGVGGFSMPQAKVNVNTAPRQVLLCLPGFDASDVDAIASHRQFRGLADPRDLSWLLDVIPRSNLQTAAAYLTGASCIYSADVVAVSGDGRGFSRFRVVIDGTKAPAYVIYRRNLHAFGWPVTREVRDKLRKGEMGIAGPGGGR